MLPHRRGYGKSHFGHHFRDSEREVSGAHGRFLHPSPEVISLWSSIEVVITRRTRNPLAFRGPWVRIPPAPPKETLFAFFGKERFAWKDFFSDASPHPQPVNKTQNALPEIRRAAHHSRALPSYPSQMYITPCPSGTPRRKRKIPERDLAAARYAEISRHHA